jgi:hypothetical protein
MLCTKEYHLPSNDSDFDTLCMKLFEIKHDLEGVQKFGRRGHIQDGVDFTGWRHRGNKKELCGGQAKYHEIGKELSLKNDVLKEIIKATKYKPTLKYYEIYTPAKRDTKIQKIIQSINLNQVDLLIEFLEKYSWEDKQSIIESLNNPLTFLVHVVFGDDIQILLNDNPDLYNDEETIANPILNRLDNAVQRIESKIPQNDNTQSTSIIDEKLNSIREYINKKDDQSANAIIIEIEKDVDGFSDKQSRRYYSYLGNIYELQGKGKESSSYYRKASEYLSEEFESRRFEIISEVNCNNIQRAFELRNCPYLS